CNASATMGRSPFSSGEGNKGSIRRLIVGAEIGAVSYQRPCWRLEPRRVPQGIIHIDRGDGPDFMPGKRDDQIKPVIALGTQRIDTRAGHPRLTIAQLAADDGLPEHYRPPL